MNTLEEARLTFQESQIIYISTILDDGVPTGAVFSGNDLYAGQPGAYQVCIDDDHKTLFDVYAQMDHALNQYQNDNPYIKMIELCCDDTMQALNLMLEERGLRPVCEDGFNFSDVLFSISNPKLATQMGHPTI